MATPSLTRVLARTQLRQMIGEPYASGVTSLNGMWLDTELNTILDQGQETLGFDTVTAQGRAPVPEVISIRMRKGIQDYQLDSRVYEVVALFMRSGSVPYPIPQIPIADTYAYITGDSSGTLAFGWNVYPRSRFLITQGIATGGGATTLEDSDRASGGVNAFSNGTQVVDDRDAALAANDIVVNLTDGSEAKISAVTDHDTLTFAAQTEDGGIMGGRRNNFELGDQYQVYAKETTRRMLRIALPPSDSDDEVVESHTTGTEASKVVGTNSSSTNVKQAMSFKVDRSTNVGGMSFKFGADTGTPLGSITLRVEGNSGGTPDGTLADFRAKAALSESGFTASAWNYFEFAKPFRLAANTTYHATLEIPAQSDYYTTSASNYHTVVVDTASGYTDGAGSENTGSWAAQTWDALFKVHAYNATESIEIHAAVMPAAMSADADILGIPEFAQTAYLWWCCWKALLKQFSNPSFRTMIAEAKQYYEMEAEKVRLYLNRQARQGYGQVKDVTTPGRRSGRFQRLAEPPEYSVIFDTR